MGNRVAGEIEHSKASALVEIATVESALFSMVPLTVASNAQTRFLATNQAVGKPRVPIEGMPAMTIALGDARMDQAGEALVETLLKLPRPGVLSIAIVAVDAPSVPFYRSLDRAFDAFLPIGVPVGGAIVDSLGAALQVVTAFATADRISLPVDGVYPFFQGASYLVNAIEHGTDLRTLAGAALMRVGMGPTSRTGRVLMHLDTTPDDAEADIQELTAARRDLVGLEKAWFSVSVRLAPTKTISVLATGAP